MAEERRVVFRRIRGRVVPIKLTAAQTRKLQAERGKKELAAGAALSVGSGALGGFGIRATNVVEQRIRRTARKARLSSIRLEKKGIFTKRGVTVLRAATKNLFRRRSILALASVGGAAGALLAETGAGRFSEARTPNEERIKTQFKENVTALGVVGASSLAFGSAAGGKRGFVQAARKIAEGLKGFGG